MAEKYLHPKDPITETFDSLKDALVAHGERTLVKDRFNTQPPYPEHFTYNLPPALIQKAFPDKEMVPESAEAYYTTPHRIDVPPEDSPVTKVGITVEGFLAGTKLPITKRYTITYDSGVRNPLSAQYSFEIADETGEVSLTSGYIDPYGRTQEEVDLQVLGRYEATSRDLTADEINGINDIIKAVASA